MIEIGVLRKLVAWTREGYRVLLATVVNTKGHAPRPVGSLLVIREDGQFSGSVSGGCAEDHLMEVIGKQFPDRPRILRYGVQQQDDPRSGLPCGGEIELLLEPVTDATDFETILRRIEQGGRITRELEVASGEASWLDCSEESAPLTFDGTRLIRTYGPTWRLFIVGAGEIGHYLAKMALDLDARVEVCEPRDAYARLWEIEAIVPSGDYPDDWLRRSGIDGHSAIVTLTHDARYDDMALLEALPSEAFYVGALGSRQTNRKRRERLTLLELNAQDIARLRGPVGLDIGSRTAPEIAIAILAEIIAVRHGRDTKLVNKSVLSCYRPSPVHSSALGVSK